MHKRIVLAWLLAAVPLAGSQAALAADPQAGFYGGLGAGLNYTNLDTGSIVGAKDEKDTAWKLFGGYQFNRYLGVEAGYVDLGKAGVGGTSAGNPAAASFESTVWQAAAVGSLPLSPQFAATAKLGVARADTDITGNIGATPIATTDRNTAPTYGLGMRYDINKNIGVRAEWERFRLGGGSIAGKSDADLFSVNALYRF
jgi:OOP family OmpA-OmpF porin